MVRVTPSTPLDIAPAYGSSMNSDRRSTRTGRMLATIALALGALAGWGVPAAESQCDAHRAGTHLEAAHLQQHPEPAAPAAWMGPAEHDCTHCPPGECARAAPCTGAASGAPGARVVPLIDPVTHRLELPTHGERQPRPAQAPPTPPPQSHS